MFTPILMGAVAIWQGNMLGMLLLDGVHEEDLQRERQQLAHVRPPLLCDPGMLELHHVWHGEAGRLAAATHGPCMQGQAQQEEGPLERSK